MFQCGCEIEKKLFRIGKAHQAITAKANEKTEVGGALGFQRKRVKSDKTCSKRPFTPNQRRVILWVCLDSTVGPIFNKKIDKK